MGVFKLAIVDRIIAYSKSKGISQVYICKTLGVDRTWLRTVKRDNTNISEERLNKIADILGTTVAYLKGETDDPTPDNKKSPSITDELLKRSDINELLELYNSFSPKEQEQILSVVKGYASSR